MNIPIGNHKIEFKFEPKAFFACQKISFIGSILLMLLLLAAVGIEIYQSKLIKKTN